MIRYPQALRAFEGEFQRRRTSDPAADRRCIGELLAWARRCGVFPPADRLEGLEVDLRLARLLNARRPA